MEYDNSRDRTLYGYDAGNIIEGDIVLDQSTGEYVILDDDGKAFSTQELFKTLLGKKIRFTCISFDAIESLEKLMARSNSQSD